MAASAPPRGWSGAAALPSPHGAGFTDEPLGGGALGSPQQPPFEFEDMVFGLLLPPAERYGGGDGAGAGVDAAVADAAPPLGEAHTASETQRGGADGPAWRCLLPAHTAECSRCVRAPRLAHAAWLEKRMLTRGMHTPQLLAPAARRRRSRLAAEGQLKGQPQRCVRSFFCVGGSSGMRGFSFGAASHSRALTLLRLCRREAAARSAGAHA